MSSLKEGYKKTEVGVIPEDWEIKSLGEISIGKGQYGIGASATEYIQGNPRYLRITDIGDSSNILFNDIKGLDDENYIDYILEEGDIVFARTGNTTGKSYVYNSKDGKLVYAGFLIKFKINSSIASNKYIKYIVQDKKYWDWVKVMSTRSGQPGINSNEYSNFKIQIPPLKEQEKIAEILCSVDCQIDDTEKLIEKCKELKKGLMQRLLTKGIGHTEFKRTEVGEIPTSWEVKKLGELGTVTIGLTYSPDDLVDSEEKGILVLRSSNIHGNTLTFSDNKYVDKDIPPKLITREGDILICSRNGSRDLIGKCAYINKANEGSSFGAFMTIYRSEYNKYLFQVFNSYLFKRQIFNNLGATINQITTSDLKSFKVPFPLLEEQEKIAQILSSVDNEIEEYEDKKQKLEQLKKGLMQQLLTGKIRVKY